jgi:hypothetical protein
MRRSLKLIGKDLRKNAEANRLFCRHPDVASDPALNLRG